MDTMAIEAQRFLSTIGLHMDVYAALHIGLEPSQDVLEFVMTLDETKVAELLHTPALHEAISRRVW